MSNILATTYDDAVAVTKSDTVDDPAGPFAGLLVSVAGTLKVTTVRNTTIAFVVVAGQTVPFPVARVWSTGSASTVFGLIANPFKRTASS